MVITDVTYSRDGTTGTTAQVTLMPASVLAIEPAALNALSARFLPDADKPSALGAANPGIGPAVTAPNAGSGGNIRSHDGSGV